MRPGRVGPGRADADAAATARAGAHPTPQAAGGERQLLGGDTGPVSATSTRVPSTEPRGDNGRGGRLPGGTAWPRPPDGGHASEEVTVTSITQRVTTLFRIKANKALDKAEDPREVLDQSYEQQQRMLQRVRRGVADVATSRKRVELQLSRLQQSTDTLRGQAERALAAGREDLAREALTRRTAVAAQITDLQAQHTSLKDQEDGLTFAAQRLEGKVDAFRTRKETLKAGYTAAEARTRITEAVTGIGEEMGDVGLAMRRAQDRTEQLQARAGALDELIDSGALDDATLPAGRDDIQAELERVTSGRDVELELARMKGELPAEPAPRAVDAGPARPEQEEKS